MYSKFIQQEKQIAGFWMKLVLVVVHTLLLMVVTVALQYTSYVRKDELGFLKWAAIIKHNVLHIDPKPLADSVVFIDVSRDITTIDDPSESLPIDSGSGIKQPQLVVTDRHKLAALFAELNRHPNDYKYVLCDVLFELPAPGDTLLKPQIQKLPRLLVAAEFQDGKLLKPVFNVPYSVVNYTAVNGSNFVKIPVFNRDIPTYPVTLYEQTTTNKFSERGYITYLNNKLSFNTVMPELYYRNEDLVKSNGHINTYDLFDLLAVPDYFSVLKGKYIVIGNFSQDRHTSYLGSIPGTLLLWDTYLTLRNRPITLNISWLVLLFLVFFSLSYWIIMHPEKKLKAIHEKIHVPLISKFIIKYISFIGLLIVINILSYFYFGTFISLFYIATYLTFLQLIIDKFPEWKATANRIIQKLFKIHEKVRPAANDTDRV